MEIYCDNAATTPLDPEVIETILPFLIQNFGNPSSTHWAGRRVKEVVNQARKSVAKLLNASPDEIFFTSGATEAINLAISGAIAAYDIDHVITSRIEHKAVLQTILQQEKKGGIKTSFVKLDERGNADLHDLENLLRANPRTLICLMHGNNEIGNLTYVRAVSSLARDFDAIFFTDTTQTIGKQQLDLGETHIDLLAGSAHKFHGPKGAGFIYINKKHTIPAQIFGGGQEHGQRGGTEHVSGIAGLAKALEVACRDMAVNHEKVSALKQYLIRKLAICGVDGIGYNGESSSPERSLANILSVSFPCPATGSLVKSLDQLGIAVSGGSACSSQGSSHVISALPHQPDKEHVRFSFSKFNTFDEVDHIVQAIAGIYRANPVQKTNQSRFHFELTH
ncbi:cysteine desulfurase family protein [Dyadobacter sandarakinus]|uniref:cysteine desulfurase n=1 Tax=Dyadobacter sandarakinus TaxID=2747268 RepID=A0ABX7I159_9BACT|nr:cysteine desulfurase family protein [Dyadobacter sandarakinus]QRQ99806.1 cysteine desulfurase [Dyadobacter sandarakinus]